MAKRHDKKKEAARLAREQQEREQKRRQLLMGTGIVAIVIVLAAVVAGGIYLNQGYPVNEPKAETSDGGLLLSEGPVEVVLYEDFICPACKSFQDANGEALNSYAAEGKIKLVFHPLAFLDGASSTQYSSRAAAASVCAADEGKFIEYETALFANQPPEGGEGLPDSQLISLGAEAGLGDKFKKCVEDDTYRGWIDEITKKAGDSGVSQTPTAIIDGEVLKDNAQFMATLDAAIAEAGGDAEAEDGASDSPSEEGKDEEASEED